MPYSEVSKKGKITIPKELRNKLDLSTGDRVEFKLEGDELRLRKIKSFDEVYHQATEDTLTEWMTDEDDAAYNDL